MVSTAFYLGKEKLRHSLGRPSRSDFVQSKFVELVNLDFGKYKNVSYYGFNAVCKEKQYDWFVIWSLLGVFIIGLGIKDMFSKNPVGFWANTETIKVKDVKGYNRASGLLFIIYGIIFVILGIPLLEGQNTPYVLLSVIGVMVETIVIMAAHSLVIVKKYEEK